MTAEIQKGRKYPEFMGRKTRLEEFHQKLVERAISVIKPLKFLNRVNDEFLKGRGKVTRKSLPCLEIFDLGWTDCYVEVSGFRIRHQMAIAFCPFLIGPNQVIKKTDQLFRHNTDTPRGTVYPGFAVLGGAEVKAVKNGSEKIVSLKPSLSTVFKIPTRLGEINKANFIKKIKPSFEEALREAYCNSALKE